MPAYNFKKQFAEKVESGEKHQTFRVDRMDGYVPEIGGTAYLYTGMRTKACRKLGQAPITHVLRTIVHTGERYISIGGRTLTGSGANVYAINDGFENADQMFEFFHEQHGEKPLKGYTVMWEEGNLHV